jgi:hypothetical protein
MIIYQRAVEAGQIGEPNFAVGGNIKLRVPARHGDIIDHEISLSVSAKDICSGLELPIIAIAVLRT